MKRSPVLRLTLTTALGAVLLAGCAQDESGASPEPSPTTSPVADGGDTTTAPPSGDDIAVALQDAEGSEVGTVTFIQAENGTTITAALTGLEPGFHGFHLHETPECDPEAAEGPFMSAGGHWNPEGVDHGEHRGDLPTLLITEDGTAEMTVTTDAFTLEDLTAEGGRAVMVHAGPDNLANIPDRYTSDESQGTAGPDDTTQRTGDSGDRVACGEPSE